MKKILLVNPWIYDFAAYDFGIKPLGLLRIAGYLRKKGHKIFFIDCLDNCSRKQDEYGFSKIKKEEIDKPFVLKEIKRPYFRYGISISEFISKLEHIKDIDEIYLTSGMTYWYPAVRFSIELLKRRFKNIPIVLGGIYATLCFEHARLRSGADVVFKGDYLDKDVFFERGLYPAFDLLSDKKMLPLQLTRGCPFECSYCAAKILTPQFEMKDPSHLFEEVMYYDETFGTKHFVFYDDALFFQSNRGIKSFLKMIINVRGNYAFHTPNGLHIRFIDEELAELLKKANFQDLRLSLETTDRKLQEFTSAKATNDDLKKALKFLKKAGFTKKDLGIYLLIGAPWLDIEKTLSDIMFINSLGAKAVLASYSAIPGTEDYENLTKSGILKQNTDPLWHNKTIFGELLLKESYHEKIKKIRRFTARLNKN